MSFSARTRTASSSFWMGVAINLVVIIVAYIISMLVHVSIGWIEFPVLILIALGLYLTGQKFWHPWYFLFGLLFGLLLIALIIGVLVGLGIIAYVLVFS